MPADRDVLSSALSAYDVGAELGRGSTGLVLAGHHRGLGRDVAIKVLPRLFGIDPELRARFLSEARLLATLDHPHIVRIYDYVEAEGVCALVMEQLPGGTVWDRLSAEKMSPQVACGVIVATCNALHYAHGKGVLHRDIKPQNLMFSGDGVLKVTDFGIAKVLGGGGAAATQPGEVLGTPAYIAPEQAQGAMLGPGVDIYATGVLLYLLLCGQLPFPPAEDPIAELYQHVHHEPVGLLERDPSLPSALGDVTARAMARDPEARYASARDFATAVSHAAAEQWGQAWASEAVRLLGAHAAMGHDSPPRASPETAPTVVPRPSPSPAAAVQPQLVERERELRAISDALQEACSGDGALILISGPPGVGVTKLADEALREGRAREMQTLMVRPDAAERDTPLAVVRRLSATLVGGDGEAERPDDADALVDRLATLAEHRPLLIVIENLHWADEASLGVLLDVVERLEARPVAVVLTAAAPLGDSEDLLDRFAGDRFAPHLRPAPLSAQGVASLLLSRWPDAHEHFCRACHAETSGNPSLLFEVIAGVETAGIAPTAAHASDVRAIALDAAARRLVARLAWLSSQAAALVHAVAVLGEDASLSQIARVADLEDAAAARAGEELAAAGILETGGTAVFAHPRLRPILYNGLPVVERSARHRAAARVLHEDGGAPDDVAVHLASTTPARDGWVVERLLAAAAGVTAAGAPDTAIGYLRRALDEPPAADQRADVLLALAEAHERAGRPHEAAGVLDEASAATGDPRRRAELLIALGDVRLRAGEVPGARAAYRQAAQLARSVGDSQVLALAALGYGLGPGDARYVAGVDETLVGLLQEALAGCEAEVSLLHVRLLSRLAVELHLTGAVDRRDALSRQAMELALLLGDPAAELVARYSRLVATWSVDDVAGRLHSAEEVLRQAQQLGDADMVARGRRLKLRALLELGDMEASGREIAALEVSVPPSGSSALAWEVALYRAMRALHDGRADDGERLALEALETGRNVDEDLAQRCFDAQIALHRWMAGHTRELVPALREGAERCPWLPVRAAALAAGMAELRRRTEAVAQFERLAADNFDSVPNDGNWLMTMAYLSLACGLLGDQRRAALLYAALTPYADRCVVGGDCTTTAPPIVTALGVLGAVLGRHEAAAGHFEAAVKRTRATGAPAHTLFTEREYARMLLARGEPGDRARATALLDDALVIAQQHGFAALAEQVEGLRASASR